MPEGSVVAEMIKELPRENVHEIARCFQARFVGQERVFLRKPDAEPTRNQKSQADGAHASDVDMVRNMRRVTV